MTRWTTPAAVLAAMLAATAPAAGDGLGPAEQQQVRDIVRDFIRENPEVVLEALRELQAREDRQQAGTGSARQYRSELRDAGDPAVGPADAAVTVVEFFDYRCGYCKRVVDSVAALPDLAPDVRIVFKELPILSEESLQAARAALAADRQGLYMPFHLALMRARGAFDMAMIMRIAEGVGLDTARLGQDMEAPEIDAAIERNYRLARALGITGTPAFVIGDVVAPGAIGRDRLLQLIDAARTG